MFTPGEFFYPKFLQHRIFSEQTFSMISQLPRRISSRSLQCLYLRPLWPIRQHACVPPLTNEELAEIEEPSKECFSLKDDDLADRKLAPVGC